MKSGHRDIIKHWIGQTLDSIYRNLPYFMISIIVLYFLSDILTSNQTYHDGADRTVPKILLISIFCLSCLSSVIAFFKEKRYKQTKPLIYILYSLFFAVSVLPLIRGSMARNLDTNTFTLSIYPLSFLTLSMFFLFYPIERCNKKVLIILYYFAVFLCVFFMLFYYFKVQSTPLSSLNFRKSIFAHIYIIVGLFPLAVLMFDKNELFFNFFLMILAIIISDKGVPLLAFGIMLLLGFATKVVHNRKLIYIGFCSLVVLVIGFLLFDLLILNRFFIGRALDQSTLIRLDGYKKIFDDLKTFSGLQLLFGKGVSAVIEARGLAAHNDFLEYLYDYGLVGFVLFTSFVVLMFFCLFRLSKKTAKTDAAIKVFAIIVAPIMLFSAIFTNANMFLFVSLGVLLHEHYRGDLCRLKQNDYNHEIYEATI